MRTYVYIDGLNLYFGALKNGPHRWLDLDALCHLLLPAHLHTITHIKYFTARVSDREENPGQSARQQIYLRALRTIPHLEIILGHFLTRRTTMRLANPPEEGPARVRVIKSEEKGSDVNIASHLLADGFQGQYEAAVLVTNDSDLLEPVRMVRRILGLPIGIISPHEHPSRVLKDAGTFTKTIRKGVLGGRVRR